MSKCCTDSVLQKNDFKSVWILLFRHRRRSKAVNICISLIFGLSFLTVALSVSAQPAWSRGEQKLSISYDECMRRANASLVVEGYRIVKQGSTFVGGQKDIHTAVIMCNLAFDQNNWVNIVVASNHRDENVPGSERLRLQGRMDQASAAGCGLGRVWNNTESGLNMTWTRRGDSNVFDVTGAVGGRPFTAEQIIEIRGNRVFINRYSALDGNTCTFEGTIQSDGRIASGTYDCTKYKPTGGWRATINCN